MRLTIAIFSAALGVLLCTSTVSAHHSFSAEFDADKKVQLSGIVTKIEWMNPHTFFYVDVETENGYENWAIELGSPNGLARRGWTRNSLKVGDSVSIEGSQARDDSFKANASTVTLSDGRRMFAGSSQETEDADQ